MITLGIDPSQRHTGVCLVDYGPAGTKCFWEIKTGNDDLLTSGAGVFTKMENLLREIPPSETIIGMERQISRSSPFLFYVQMQVLAVIHSWAFPHTPKIILPLPVQLQSVSTCRFFPRSARVSRVNFSS